MVKARKKPSKLSLAKAVKYYKEGYPEDGIATLEFCKAHPVEGAEIIEEVSAFVNAATLEEACKLAVGFDYGCNFDDPPDDWRSHVEGISAIRKASGHYELDFSEESIISDLVTLVNRFRDGKESEFCNNPLSFLELDKRLSLVYPNVLKEFK